MARDLAMNVALAGGRWPHSGARGLVQGGTSIYDAKVEANIVGHEPLADRVAFAARLAANWARLRQRNPAERRDRTSSWPIIPTATAGSAMASGSIRRRARSKC